MFILTVSMKIDGVPDYCGHLNIGYQAAEPLVVLQNFYLYICRQTQSQHFPTFPSSHTWKCGLPSFLRVLMREYLGIPGPVV